MSEKIAIVYIGGKPEKRIEINQKKLIFRGGNPLHVDSETASCLLEFDGVFAYEKEAKERLAEKQAEAEALEAQRAAEAEAEAKQVEAESWEVVIGGEVKDISKYIKGKLLAVIESEDLEGIETNGVLVEEIREQVRDALKAKQKEA